MPSCLFKSLEFFLSKLALHGLEAAASCYEGGDETVHSPNEMEEYNRSKCDVIIGVLKFVGILVDHRHDNTNSVCL
jgi:hypothetical protein